MMRPASRPIKKHLPRVAMKVMNGISGVIIPMASYISAGSSLVASILLKAAVIS